MQNPAVLASKMIIMMLAMIMAMVRMIHAKRSRVAGAQPTEHAL